MARRRYPRSNYYRNSRYDRESRGRKFALRHIEQANNLSATLGGTDKKVKEYLFRLDAPKLKSLLDEYGSIYGSSAKSYAQRTMPKWRSGHTYMSGLVASRIYSLLPPRMPARLKFSIAEDLWRHVGPRSSKRLRFGPLSSVTEVVNLTDSHISSVVTNYSIPDSLQRQFNWLSSNDVQVKQELLNHLQSMDKNLVVEAVTQQVPVMMEHMKLDTTRRTKSFTYEVSVGNHKLLLIADHKGDSIRLEDGKKQSDSDTTPVWVWFIVIGIVVAIVIFANIS